MKTYYLQDSGGYKIAKFEIDGEDVYLDGNVYMATTWNCTNDVEPVEWKYHSGVSIKFDGCSHWYFRGEDYQDGSEEIDSYYHLCGTENLKEHIVVICFVWEIARRYFKRLHKEMRYDKEFDDTFIKKKLNGYKIITEEL